MGLDVKLIDESLAGRSAVAEIAGENGLLKQLTKAILERALSAELTALNNQSAEPVPVAPL
jgi:putative transposase